MNSGIRALDKSKFLSFAQRLSKNKISNSYLPKNDNNQKLYTKNSNSKSSSDLIYSNIVPSKERSRSLNAMMSNVFKHTNTENKINELNDLNDLNLNYENNNSNIQIYDSRKKADTSFCSDLSDELLSLNNHPQFSRRNSNASNESMSDKKSCISFSTSHYSKRIYNNFDILMKKNIYNKSNETTRPNSSKTSYNSNTNSSSNNYSNSNNNNYSYNYNYTEENKVENPLSSHNYKSPYISNTEINNNSPSYKSFRSSRKTIFNNNLKHVNNSIRNNMSDIKNFVDNDNTKKYYPKLKFSNNTNSITNPNINNRNNSNTYTSYTEGNVIEDGGRLKQSSSQSNILKKEILKNSKILNSSSSTSDINQNNNFKNSTVIQLEDLIVLEEKLFHISENFSNINSLSKLCIEWWNFYTYTTFGGKFEIFFPKTISIPHQIAHETSVLELLSIIIIYEIIKDNKIGQTTLNSLINLIREVHQNYLITCDYVLSTINADTLHGNIWINKLQNIIKSKSNHIILKNEHINQLKKGNHSISNIIKSVIKTYSYHYNSGKINSSTLNYYFKNVSRIRINTLNEYFRKKINQDCVKTGASFVTFATNVENNNADSITVPYLSKRINRGKKFTLVLDLDETLISFHINEQGKGILIPRPFLLKFLTEMNKIFELVVFTAGTQEYADPILNIIDKKNFFDKRLYRQHCVILENVFVKDLSKLGRDLSKVIIIENTPQNFQLQKENGIFIKNFYGEDKNDSALLDLIPILKTVTNNENNDVRIELKKLKNEIFTKITTNLQIEDK